MLPSLEALPDVTPLRKQNLTTQPLIIQACTDIDNQDLCLSNIQAELQNLGPQTPSSVLHAALRATLNEARQTIETITKFTGLSVSYREQIAIEDCKELLDFSVSELAWSLAEMKKIRDGDRSAEYEGNLKAWLSAALSNQDTCLEGFEGTDRHLESFIRGSLKQVTQLIGNVLAMYTQLHSLPFRPPRNSTSTNTSSKFPKWITEGDQELLRTNPGGMHVDAVVSLDGSRHYRTITDAINEAPSYSNRRYIIYVKKGVYKENIDMKKKKTNIMLVGDGIGQTVVTGNRNFLQGLTTFRTATVAVVGKGFVAVNITFRNTAGAIKHQAVAVRNGADMSTFYSCSFEGYQDTLYAHSLRQFYRECDIYGTIDFIFGNAAVVLQNCNIYPRLPLPNQFNTITAQGRIDPNQNTGISIHNCVIRAADDLASSNGTTRTYLGRPWKEYSRTLYMQSFMESLIEPSGWSEWSGDFALDTLYYAEYNNKGPGSNTNYRVTWPGYHSNINEIDAANFTVSNFIQGDCWLPATGVPFHGGLF
ncbi:hypothetical protein CRYUN_Cryun05aG0008500 [Craigia yunnanensis]